MRPSYASALNACGALPRLAAFSPVVIGTPALGLDLPDSDIDIACHAPDLDAFGETLDASFGHLPGYRRVRRDIRGVPSVIARFTAERWPIEVFGQPVPVARQYGVRHFRIAQRLLERHGQLLRNRVMAARRRGAKTEPALCAILKLPGDPYEALLELEAWPPERIDALGAEL